MNIRMAWLEIAVKNGDTSRLPELKDYAGPSFEFETRINAIKALQKLNYIDFDLAVNLVKAARHWNPKLSKPAIETLNSYYQQPENKSVIEKALKSEHTDKREAGITDNIK
ncbi:MAG: hypothetical protein HGA37_16080 [Lentimicrobium sp.]|nr:hypothetical protein [Lentimicrobium sp.]